MFIASTWRRMVAVAAGVTLSVVALIPAQGSHAPSSDGGKTKQTGEWDTSIEDPPDEDEEEVYLVIYTEKKVKVRFCVTPPRKCKTFTTTKYNEFLYWYEAPWSKHWPDEGPGKYRVKYKVGDKRLGKVLGFHRD